MGKEIPLLKPFSSNKITVVHTIRMHMHLIMKNSKKCYFKVLEKIEKNAHMYILC
jgi:ribosomal protein L22